jgi:single-stranded-DNA-specific exonuclease
VLDEANTRRRALEAETYSQAAEMCEHISAPAIVLSHTDWHQGVTGIVASRLMYKYGKPVFIISVSGDTGKGTARCPKHICLTSVLERCAGTLIGYGGHSAAAGFTVAASRTDDFKNAVLEAVGSLDASSPEETLTIDAEVESGDLTVKNAEGIAALKPFGAGNPEPVLLLRGVYIKQIIPLKGGRHLRLMISAHGAVFPVICFGFEQSEFRFRPGDIADIAFCLSLNRFRGVTLQLELRDIR